MNYLECSWDLENFTYVPIHVHILVRQHKHYFTEKSQRKLTWEIDFIGKKLFDVGSTILCDVSQPLIEAWDILDRKPQLRKCPSLLISSHKDVTLKSSKRKQLKGLRSECKELECKESCRRFKKGKKEPCRQITFIGVSHRKRCHLFMWTLENLWISLSKKAALLREESCFQLNSLQHFNHTKEKVNLFQGLPKLENIWISPEYFFCHISLLLGLTF